MGADECRIGRGALAWHQAEYQVAHGEFRTWMAQNAPNFLKQLGADLTKWS